MRQTQSGLWVLVFLSLSPTVHAQGQSDDVRRNTIIQQATQARRNRNWTQVVQLLEQAAEIRATASVRLGLAGAYSELGDFQASARQASLCMQLAPAEHSLPDEQRANLTDSCGQVLREASSRIATVTIDVSPVSTTAPSLAIDGAPVTDFAPGRPFYLPPGQRRLRLSSPGRRAWDSSNLFTAGERAHLHAELPVLDPANSNGAAIFSDSMRPTPLPAQARSSTESSASIVPWMLAGAGVIVGAAGGAFHYLSIEAQGQRDARCDPSGCDLDAIDHDRRYRDLNTISNVSMTLGGALVLSGVVWLIVDRSLQSGRSPHRASLRPGAIQWSW